MINLPQLKHVYDEPRVQLIQRLKQLPTNKWKLNKTGGAIYPNPTTPNFLSLLLFFKIPDFYPPPPTNLKEPGGHGTQSESMKRGRRRVEEMGRVYMYVWGKTKKSAYLSKILRFEN